MHHYNLLTWQVVVSSNCHCSHKTLLVYLLCHEFTLINGWILKKCHSSVLQHTAAQHTQTHTIQQSKGSCQVASDQMIMSASWAAWVVLCATSVWLKVNICLSMTLNKNTEITAAIRCSFGKSQCDHWTIHFRPLCSIFHVFCQKDLLLHIH